MPACGRKLAGDKLADVSHPERHAATPSRLQVARGRLPARRRAVVLPRPNDHVAPTIVPRHPNNIALAGSEIYVQSAVIGTSANSAFDGAAQASDGLKIVLGY